MIEDDWLNQSTWPERMLLELHSAWRDGQVKVSDRQLRLFGCACCRHVLSTVKDKGVEEVVSVVERHVDGTATDNELRLAGDAIERAWHEGMEAAEGAWLTAPDPALHLVEAAAFAAGRTPGCMMTGGWYGHAMSVAMK